MVHQQTIIWTKNEKLAVSVGSDLCSLFFPAAKVCKRKVENVERNAKSGSSLFIFLTDHEYGTSLSAHPGNRV